MVNWEQIESFLKRKYEFEAERAIDATTNPDYYRGRAKLAKEFLNLRGAIEALDATEMTDGRRAQA